MTCDALMSLSNCGSPSGSRVSFRKIPMHLVRSHVRFAAFEPVEVESAVVAKPMHACSGSRYSAL